MLRFADKNLLATGLFGLCPLLVKSTTLLSASLMGAAMFLVLLSGSVTVSLCRHFIPCHARFVFILLVNASWVMALDLLLQAGLYEMRLQLGIYIPLLAVNATLLLMQEQLALRQGLLPMLCKTMTTGFLLLLSLLILGGVRELLVSGGLLTDSHLLPPNSYTASIQAVYLADTGALLFNKPAGAFICFGLLVASVNYACTTAGAVHDRPVEKGVSSS